MKWTKLLSRPDVDVPTISGIDLVFFDLIWKFAGKKDELFFSHFKGKDLTHYIKVDAQELGRSIYKEYFKEDAEVIYYVGCTTAYRERQLFDSVIPILQKLEVDFTLLEDEVCCGSPLLTTGQFKAAKRLAEQNARIILEKKGSIVIASCAGCLRTLKSQYEKKYGIKIDKEILHLSEFLTKKLKLTSVVVTHNMESVFRIADRVAMLYQGKIIFVGTPDQIKNSGNALVHQFITGSAEGPIETIRE